MDNGRHQTAAQLQHPQQSLPSISALTSGLPPNDQNNAALHHRNVSEVRDSGNWSLSQGASKHSSVVSTSAGLNIQTILNAEDSPARNSMPETPSSARYPSGPPNGLPLLSQGFENRNSTISNEIPSSHLESRRSSVDSRVNHGMNHLAISPSSPYESQNASRVSLVSNLQQQRGVPQDPRQNVMSPLSPLGPRANGTPRSNAAPRRAPVIGPIPRGVSGAPDPTAQAPTKGFAWAFPDVADIDERRASSSSSEHRLSRQNSFAASVNSSVYTHDSSMPVGQKRFDDDIGTTHHHSMQHRSVISLQPDHGASPQSGNYSRTPELRVSHKMAERKRRSEMKGLFDELNGILPNSPGSKSSKWEILTKSIEYIRSLQRSQDLIREQNARLRPDAEYAHQMRSENEALKSELATLWQAVRRADPNNPHIYGQMTSALAQQQSHGPAGGALPPIAAPPQAHANAHWGPPPPSAMQGVEFANSRAYEHR
ncbi:hypothetical protein EJ05DRAFT_487551 [Pseudovirgaria hyperparasitica]|uniref:BHLH domain-containing protein n=1 Tax=Pseudovirgaria hyperparasitica TaxID=470096 RepID=A0A6A6W3Z4_9PEZI|nr:uncharacterized protein EJ05DRAFT_487551 [Pseudovirgaria hyperparasitica]KAF2756686.1 hypothetical protein EJ05DRAFT_487551 [Pseudovirgaria hyperparasitica]